jgi:hypothetical protein
MPACKGNNSGLRMKLDINGKRYEELLEFYENHDMKEEKEWVSKRIKMIQQSS